MKLQRPRPVRLLTVLFALMLAAPALAQNGFVGTWSDSFHTGAVRLQVATVDATHRTMTVTFVPTPTDGTLVCNTYVPPGNLLVITLNGTLSGNTWSFAVASELIGSTPTPTFGTGSTGAFLTSTTDHANGPGALDGLHETPAMFGSSCAFDITSGSITHVDTPQAGDQISLNFNSWIPGQPGTEDSGTLVATWGTLPVELQSFTVK